MGSGIVASTTKGYGARSQYAEYSERSEWYGAGLFGLDEHDIVARTEEAHGDAAAHEPRADDAHGAHRRG